MLNISRWEEKVEIESVLFVHSYGEFVLFMKNGDDFAVPETFSNYKCMDMID